MLTPHLRCCQNQNNPICKCIYLFSSIASEYACICLKWRNRTPLFARCSRGNLCVFTTFRPQPYYQTLLHRADDGLAFSILQSFNLRSTAVYASRSCGRTRFICFQLRRVYRVICAGSYPVRRSFLLTHCSSTDD